MQKKEECIEVEEEVWRLGVFCDDRVVAVFSISARTENQFRC